MKQQKSENLCVFFYSINQIICFLGIIFFSWNVQSQSITSSSKLDLKKNFQKWIQESSLPSRSIGVAISSILSDFNKDKDRLDFEHNANHLFIPASLSKIVTAGTLLEHFVPFYRFETSFLSSSSIVNGEINGDLYLRGGGDPSFVSESLWNLVNHLTRTQLKLVRGHLIIDDSLFKKKSKRRFFFLSDRSFNALSSALSFNWNAVNVYIRPGLNAGDRAKVQVDPESDYIQLSNTATTSYSQNDLKVSRVSKKNYKDTIYVKGSVPIGQKEKLMYKSVSYPSWWTGHQAMAFLKRRNIYITHSLKKGKTPSYATLLAQHKGRTVFQLVQDMMKFSSNFLADMLMIQLSLYKGDPGSVHDGLKWAHQYLKRRQITDYVFENPSGLTRRNKFKPKDILTLLRTDTRSLPVYEMISSYPVAREGTLRNRFHALSHPLQVRAKTGQLSGVDAIAGYVINRKNQKRAFVFIYNGSNQKKLTARALFDRMILALSQ